MGKDEDAKVQVTKDEQKWGALAHSRFEKLYGQKLSDIVAPGKGTVPCHRAACQKRHKYTYIAVLGKGYCCAECCKIEKAYQEESFSKHVKDGKVCKEGFNDCDPSYVLLYKQNLAPLSKLRPQVLELDNTYRPQFERCCRLVEDRNEGKLENAKMFFQSKAVQFNKRLSQTTGDMADNYRAAHECYVSIFSALAASSAAAGLDPNDEGVVAFGLKDPVRVQHKSAAYVLSSFNSPTEAPDDNELRKLLHNHSKNTDFLRFAITIPNDRAELMPKVYEQLCLRFTEEHFVNNKLTPKAYRGEQSMYILCNYKLNKKGHAFEVQLRFRGFHDLERKQHRTFEWLRLLRGLHHVLPGESDEYEGQMDKDGRTVEVPSTPTSELPGMKANGEGTMCYAMSGSMYKGQWKMGRPHGRGSATQVTGELYEGQYKDGRKVGKGFTQFSDGDSYSGQYTDGRCTGVGIYRYATGAVYEGQFVNGMGEGIGTYRYTDGQVFEGEWVDDKKSGKGIMWSIDRQSANTYDKGAKGDKVSIEEACNVTKALGFSGKPPERTK